MGSGHAVLAGVVTALVGFTSSFAVVLTGLSAVGASTDEAASGLLVLTLLAGVGCAAASWATRAPVTLAWSTPGAALLATAAAPDGGFAAAAGAFAVCGVLLAVAGTLPVLTRLVARIPTALAQAMLAGVLLGLCTAPVQALVDAPAVVAPVVLTWLVLTAWPAGRRWAVPGALVVAVVAAAVEGSLSGLGPSDAAPSVALVVPTLDLGTVVAIALPLWVVTMTSQNVPGIAVLASFGYRPDLRGALGYAGAATTVASFGGGHALNLAAISAALAAGPEAHPDPDRRWVAGVAAGATYVVLAPLSGLVTAVAAAAPAGLVATIAGLALLGTLAAAAGAALADPATREAAAVTLVVAASGVVVAGVGAAFWALVAGGVVLAALRFGARRTARRTAAPEQV